MSKIENYKYSLSDAFKQCFYIVPDYQREYVWRSKEVNQLLNDIDNAKSSNSDGEYFIGTILVSPIDDQKDTFAVIDGQQRLTTLFLLVIALRAKLKKEEDYRQLFTSLISDFSTKKTKIEKQPKLNPQYQNAESLMRMIIENDASPEELYLKIKIEKMNPFGSLKALTDAYAEIWRHLEQNYKDESQLKELWSHLSSKVIFIQISTDVGSALKIFETINERGVGLSPMDLLKNLLFSEIKQTEFSKLKTEWRKISKPLEKNKERPLRFLRYFIMANYKVGSTTDDAIVREDGIYDWFSRGENKKLTDIDTEPFKFVSKLSKNVQLYLALKNGQGNDLRDNTPVKRLRFMTGGAFSLHYILLLAAAPLPKSLFDHFVAQLESFLFYYIFTKTPTRDLERAFSIWADELRTIGNLTDETEQISRLNGFIENRFQKGIQSKQDELHDALIRYSSKKMQKFRTKYLLCCLTEYVENQFHSKNNRTDLSLFNNLEIEHILPEKPKTKLLKNWSNGVEEEVYQTYVAKLGNLMLLEKSLNIIAGNKFYQKKTKSYKNSGNYLARSIAVKTKVGKNSKANTLNEKLTSFSKWEQNDIDARQKMLACLVPNIWSAEPF